MKGPIAVVTTFGLGRTPAQVGMLEALVAQGVQADFVVGTSLGAINAAAFAAGRTTEQMSEFWLWMYDEVLASPVRAIARGLTARQARRPDEQVREPLSERLPDSFDELTVPLRLLATDLESGNEVVLDSGDLPRAVMASCALPGLLPPVTVNGSVLIDGGLVAGMPLRSVPAQARTIIVLDTGHSAVAPEVVAGYRWWEVGALAYAHLIRGQAVNVLARTASRVPVVMISTNSGRLLDFDTPGEAVDAGRAAAQDCLQNLPARLRRGIYGLPTGLDEFAVLQKLQVPQLSA
jgi:NTE family protein